MGTIVEPELELVGYAQDLGNGTWNTWGKPGEDGLHYWYAVLMRRDCFNPVCPDSETKKIWEQADLYECPTTDVCVVPGTSAGSVTEVTLPELIAAYQQYLNDLDANQDEDLGEDQAYVMNSDGEYVPVDASNEYIDPIYGWTKESTFKHFWTTSTKDGKAKEEIEIPIEGGPHWDWGDKGKEDFPWKVCSEPRLVWDTGATAAEIQENPILEAVDPLTVTGAWIEVIDLDDFGDIDGSTIKLSEPVPWETAKKYAFELPPSAIHLADGNATMSYENRKKLMEMGDPDVIQFEISGTATNSETKKGFYGLKYLKGVIYARKALSKEEMKPPYTGLTCDDPPERVVIDTDCVGLYAEPGASVWVSNCEWSRTGLANANAPAAIFARHTKDFNQKEHDEHMKKYGWSYWRDWHRFGYPTGMKCYPTGFPGLGSKFEGVYDPHTCGVVDTMLIEGHVNYVKLFQKKKQKTRNPLTYLRLKQLSTITGLTGNTTTVVNSNGIIVGNTTWTTYPIPCQPVVNVAECPAKVAYVPMSPNYSLLCPLVVDVYGIGYPDLLAGPDKWERERKIGDVNLDNFRRFDIEGIGTRPSIEWVGPKTGLLVYGEKGNMPQGLISGKMLFGNFSFGKQWADGYEALSTLDKNVNGLLEGKELNEVFVWVDANSNAVIDSGECRASSDYFQSLSVRPTAIRKDVWCPEGGTLHDGRVVPSWDWWTKKVELTLPQTTDDSKEEAQKVILYQWKSISGQITGVFRIFEKKDDKGRVTKRWVVLSGPNDNMVLVAPVSGAGHESLPFSWTVFSKTETVTSRATITGGKMKGSTSDGTSFFNWTAEPITSMEQVNALGNYSGLLRISEKDFFKERCWETLVWRTEAGKIQGNYQFEALPSYKSK